jgi:hypothetical protein
MSFRRIRFYSDESYAPCGNKRSDTVIAGIALSEDRINVRDALLQAEGTSRKGHFADWRCTTAQARADYIDAVLGIPAIKGRVFFQGFDALPNGQRSDVNVSTLSAAIRTYTPGNCHHQMMPEGFRSAGRRYNLRCELKKRGCEGVTVESADFIAHPEVRLADALAGYIRGELYREDGTRAVLTNLPDWFVDLQGA